MDSRSGYALLWSGGKDSALALHRARVGGLDVRLLLNVYDPATSRVRFHATRAELIASQARAIGIGLRAVGIPWEDFDRRLREELRALADAGYRGVVLGDVHLADVREWYESRVAAAGLEHVEPLWGGDPLDLVTEFVAGGGRAVITCVQESSLDESWLGRVLDGSFPQAIAATAADPCGERGEYHSFAFAGPVFQREVAWRPGEVRREGGFVQLDLLPG
jgi:uncharacterized protein (TIGR00290 family)